MNQRARFAVCIRNSGYPAALELRKLYEVIEDADAEKDDLLRIIDESGAAYLYTADRFVFAPLAAAAEQAVVEAVNVTPAAIAGVLPEE